MTRREFLRLAAAAGLSVVVSRRLLMACGGGGASSPLAVATALGVNGAWSHIGSPRALFLADTTILGAVVGGSLGDCVLHAYDHVAESASSFVLRAALGGAEGNPDHHGNPAMVVMPNGKLLTAFAGHDAPELWIRISTNAAPDISSFAAAVNIDSSVGGSDYTYIALVVLGSSIYLFYRDESSGIGRLAYTVSTDNAATWSARTILFSPGAARTAYWKVAGNGVDRVDIFVTDGSMPNETAPVKTYHLYLQGGARYKSDGTVIAASLPLGPSDLTLVYDGADGRGWPFDAAIRPDDGTPQLALQVAVDGDTDNSLRDVRWRSGAWSSHEISRSDGIVVANISPGVVYDHMNPDKAYVNRLVAGAWEMFDATTIDDGATWEVSQITVGSAEDQLSASPVEDHDGRMPVVWFTGPYVDYLDFDSSIVGLLRAA